ncbi:flagellar M-ring protein FliF C-terminal domain-containing protein [Otoolea muris]|uniref:flagellar M-ring protein FliF C-terminal domain-containing protein n=1 Tax=Otoolea muris TaxID=2941515 RepID=UPI00203B9277|nr:flagellar M-ring protein FliF C-terminal domain-containing protein [Otoolea muris]
MQNMKEYWQNLSGKTKKLLIAIVSATAVIAISGVVALNYLAQRDYSVLFTGLNQEEAQQVVSLLQEQGYPYRYDDNDGAIRMPSASVDQARVQLLSQGYPKSGFTYDMYRDNSGLMTTESDKKQYTKYELQDRLGAQIRLFEGVQDAKVTIAEAGEQKYALDTVAEESSAAVTVTMKSGRSLTDNQAAAIKNLIARSVRGMTFTNVSVFDAESMVEIGANDGTGGSGEYTELTSEIENHIAGNVRRVLEKLYGQGNVAVSVKGTLNTDKLIQEVTRYTVPEKIDAEDKTGLLEREDTTFENQGTQENGAGGVAGADANADTPRYTAGNGNGNGTDTYANGSASREWLFDTLREQRQVDPGVLENTTIAIVIDTADMSIDERDLISLVANASGIAQDQAADKITIIRASSATEGEEDEDEDSKQAGTEPETGIPTPIIIALIAGGVLLLLLLIIILLLARSRRKKAIALEESADEWPQTENQEGETPPVVETEAARQFREENAEMEQNEEILNLRMQHSLRLKQNIGEFIEQNPQIAAKLVQSWLRGEEDGGESRGKRK